MIRSVSARATRLSAWANQLLNCKRTICCLRNRRLGVHLVVRRSAFASTLSLPLGRLHDGLDVSDRNHVLCLIADGVKRFYKLDRRSVDMS